MSRVLFVHIPKTAGMALQITFLAAGCMIKGYVREHKKLPDMLKKYKISPDTQIVAVVRNPFDRIYAIYEFYHKQRDDIRENTFKDFLYNYGQRYAGKIHWAFSCHEYIQLPSTTQGLTILRYETLGKDLREFCEKYGLSSVRLIVENINGLKYKPAKKTIYTKEMRDIVEQYFRDDLDIYDYSYEQWLKEPWGR